MAFQYGGHDLPGGRNMYGITPCPDCGDENGFVAGGGDTCTIRCDECGGKWRGIHLEPHGLWFHDRGEKQDRGGKL